MSIFDEIDAATTPAELSDLWINRHKVMTALRAKVKADEIVRSDLSEMIDIESQTLRDYGNIKEIRFKFYEKLGELHKDEL